MNTLHFITACIMYIGLTLAKVPFKDCGKDYPDLRCVWGFSGGSRISRRGGRGPRTGGPWTPEAGFFFTD